MTVPEHFQVNDRGHLEIGGCDTVQLAEQYKTPLMVYDEQLIRNHCRAYKQAFQDEGIQAQVAYASKAFSTIAMCQLAKEEGMSLDVVSGGELYTALQADFPVEKIHFHGNNKTAAEINMALEADIGCFVVDNFHELSLLQNLAQQHGKVVNILLRISPGVEAHTHEYISTGQEDSKFGFDLASGQVEDALHKAIASPNLRVLGLHSHIGSQIFDTQGFQLVIHKIAQFLDEMKERLDWQLSVLNVGGGFGIWYSDEDTPMPINESVAAICQSVQEVWQQRNEQVPEVWIEPGRSIVGEAGITLYKVGAQKTVPGIRQYVSVDGGMSDNIRVALYKAKYVASLANRARDEHDHVYTVAGKLCETGDILIHDALLPEVEADDLMVMFSTGAYGYSMANNYNRITRPCVLFAKDGEAQIVVRAETHEDLVRLDVPLKSKVKDS